MYEQPLNTTSHLHFLLASWNQHISQKILFLFEEPLNQSRLLRQAKNAGQSPPLTTIEYHLIGFSNATLLPKELSWPAILEDIAHNYGSCSRKSSMTTTIIIKHQSTDDANQKKSRQNHEWVRVFSFVLNRMNQTIMVILIHSAIQSVATLFFLFFLPKQYHTTLLAVIHAIF